MTYISGIDPGISIDVDTGVIDTNELSLLNAFGPAETIASYDKAGGDDTLENGEPLGVETEEGTTLDGIYRGDLTLSTTSPSISVPLLGGLEVQLNPVEGELYEASDGSFYMISEDPVNDARIGITATVSLLGSPPLTFEGDLSELDAWLNDIPGIGPILDAVGDTGQWVLDTAVTTLNYDSAGTLVVCFVRGTLIETENGMRPIEELDTGDRVMTRDNGIKQIRWIGSTKLCAKTLAASHNLRPIRIKVGALGENTPSKDLLVSPQHRVLVRSRIAQRMFGAMEILVPAKQLCQLDGIDVAEDLAEVEYFHFLFDQHEVVYSNGAETESLYPGPQALKSVGVAAREEIFALFPEFRSEGFTSISARELPSGRKARKLAMRHRMNGKPLVMGAREAVSKAE